MWAGIYIRRSPDEFYRRRFNFRYDVDWLKRFKIRGVVIGRNILFADPPDSIPVWTFRHELEHAYQIMRDGTLKFYWRYFVYQIRYGYFENPYEDDARAAEYLPLTYTEEEILWKLKDESQK